MPKNYDEPVARGKSLANIDVFDQWQRIADPFSRRIAQREWAHNRTGKMNTNPSKTSNTERRRKAVPRRWPGRLGTFLLPTVQLGWQERHEQDNDRDIQRKAIPWMDDRISKTPARRLALQRFVERNGAEHDKANQGQLYDRLTGITRNSANANSNTM